MLYQNIKIAADAMVFSKSSSQWQLLLITRKNDPFKGMWAFPGGFVEDDEDLEAAAIRELEEETGVTLSSMKQLHTYGKPGRDPRFRTVSVIYTAITDSSAHNAAGGDDAADAQWINISDITELAFDHKEILAYAMQQLGIEA
ncbi:MAG: hydrolase [Flavipsychrobacter sp.]|nr:hydrolase [Flavipsychrobacter sp.]